MKFKAFLFATIAFALCLAVSVGRAQRVNRTAETQLLGRISAVSQPLGRQFGRLMFREGFASPDARDALVRAAEWVEKNRFAGFKSFAESLSLDDVDLLFALLKDGPLGSEPQTPVSRDLSDSGQSTVLTFPFDGEMFVVQGNEEMISHKPGTSNVFAWDFVVMRNGATFRGNSAHNENHFAWDLPVRAPAPGRVAEAVGDNPDHPPLTAKMGPANYVVIDHENGEVSRIFHLRQGSLVVKKGDRVTRGQVIGKTGDSGTSMFPHIHYQLDHVAKDGAEPFRARFACYLVRDSDKEPGVHLIVSGVPARGEYVRNVPPDGVVTP